MKKIISLLLAFVLLIGCFSISVSAKGDIVVMGQMRSKKLHGASANNHKQTAENALSKYVDLDDFTLLVMSGISKCKKEIDVSRYDIPTSAFDSISDYFFYGVPEAFNVDLIGCNYYSSTRTIADITVVYNSFANNASEYDSCFAKMSSAADKLLSGIKGNDALDDVQKLLLLHDRLVIWNSYDYDRLQYGDPIIYTAYGALGEGRSVCQGYAMAYMYLLNQLGIESYYCSSDVLNHGWNIVILNGKKYHIDVTWDDTDYLGEVRHDNFLRSSSGMYATGHEAFDFDYSPNDTTYDNYFWQESNAEFQLVNNELYYIDHMDYELKRYSDKKSLCSVEYSYSTLANDGRSLFYSLDDGIYRFDLTDNRSESIYKPSLVTGEILCGMEYSLDTLYCLVYNYNTGVYQVIEQPYTHNYDVVINYGDANGDGKINGRDYTLLIQHINGWIVALNLEEADVNADGKINGRDYALLIQYINGWDVTLGPKA